MLTKTFLRDVNRISNNTQSGAGKIAEECLEALRKECIKQGSELNIPLIKTAIQLLLNTHPMGTIENALFPIFIRLTKLFQNPPVETATIDMVFNTHVNGLRRGEKKTRENLVDLLKDKKSILTFTHSSTVIQALLQLATTGHNNKEIYVLESRPLKEGERTAHTLANAGFKEVIFGVDFALHEFSTRVSTAVLGADTIHANGNILNKLGSTTIAQVFHAQAKEIIVAASLSKICLRSIIDHKMPTMITEQDPRDISSLNLPNLTIWNKYFEIIPPKYITMLVMDENRFPAPIENHLKDFVATDNKLSRRIEGLREAWYNVEYTMV